MISTHYGGVRQVSSLRMGQRENIVLDHDEESEAVRGTSFMEVHFLVRVPWAWIPWMGDQTPHVTVNHFNHLGQPGSRQRRRAV
jgi:hypothetical protein